MHDSVPTQAVATVLGLPQLRFSLDIDLGGQAPCHLVAQAAAAVTTGQAEAVLVFRAHEGPLGRAGRSMEFAGGGGQYRYPLGYSAYMMYVAMWAQRFLAETGQGRGGPRRGRRRPARYALDNERAFRRRPLDWRHTWNRRYVVDPFRAAIARSRSTVPARCSSPPLDGPATCAIRRRSSPRAATGRVPLRARHRRPPALARLHAQLHEPGFADDLYRAPGSDRPTCSSPRSTTASPAPC